MTVVEFTEICNLVCPHCRSGAIPRFRPETNEWVHDAFTRVVMAHTICWATGFRTSRFAKEASQNG